MTRAPAPIACAIRLSRHRWRLSKFSTLSILSVALGTLACSSHPGPQGRTRSPALASPSVERMGVTEAQAQPAPLARGERARELVQAAQLQIRDLEDIRAASISDAQGAAIDRQMATVSRLRDAVLADLGTDTAQLDVDLPRLERAMQSAAATAPAISPALPPIERRDSAPGGGYELFPPER
jgi:hypothetical protein